MPDPVNPEPAQPIDAVGADPVITIPEVEPTWPTVADLLPAAVRRVVYALLGVLIPLYTIYAADPDVDPPSWTNYVFAALIFAGFGVAASNVPKKVN